jgi:hypothetical protein
MGNTSSEVKQGNHEVGSELEASFDASEFQVAKEVFTALSVKGSATVDATVDVSSAVWGAIPGRVLKVREP